MATPGPPANAPSYTQSQIDTAIDQAARQYGVPAQVLYAVAQTESGLNPNEPGGGMYQDIVGGEAGNAIFGGNPENVYNLQDSANNAAQTIAAAKAANPSATWGAVAAIAQKPKNTSAYAQTVNSYLTDPLSQLEAPSAPIPATLTSDVTTNTGSGTSTTGDGVTTGPTKLATPLAGVDIKNFHGYDLTPFTGGDSKYLGEAEQAILKFVSDPQLEKLVVTSNSNNNAEYGYSSFSLKIPQLNTVMITSALAPNAQFDQNTLQGIISNTDWYKQTDQNQRVWEAALVSDPASAHNALVEAQDKVLATANQVGVSLTKQQLDQIANMYAAQSYTPTNILGSSSGTSQEWLDQAVVNTAENIKATGAVTPGGTNQQYDYAGGTTDLTSSTAPTAVTGVLQSVYQGLLQAAQSYLLYSPSNPESGAMSSDDIMGLAEQAMQGYTGTGASGQISQFVNGEVAKYTEQFKQQASSLYPSLATAIQQGVTPQSYITPLTNYVSNITGMGQGQINVMDPQWNWIVSSPGQNGVLGPVTQDQALQKIASPNFSWTTPDGQRMTYDNTNAAMQTANGMSSSLKSMFGVGGT